MFVLGEKTGFGKLVTEYYTGKTYVFQHEYYPVTSQVVSEAKRYSSKIRAENACDKLNNKVGRIFEVEEIS